MAFGAMVIILVITATAIGSTGGFDGFLDFFSEFGKTQGERLCDREDGQWCKNFYTCQPGHDVPRPAEYDGVWKCCEEEYCLPMNQIGWFSSQVKDDVKDMVIAEFELVDTKTNNVYDIPKLLSEGTRTVDVVLGAQNPYVVEISIEYPEKGF